MVIEEDQFMKDFASENGYVLHSLTNSSAEYTKQLGPRHVIFLTLRPEKETVLGIKYHPFELTRHIESVRCVIEGDVPNKYFIKFESEMARLVLIQG